MVCACWVMGPYMATSAPARHLTRRHRYVLENMGFRGRILFGWSGECFTRGSVIPDRPEGAEWQRCD
jgi:hypothetical protein